MAEALDLVNRDPQDLNRHLRAVWADVIAEPDGTHSVDGCWKCSFQCFNMAKGCLYKLLTCFLGWIFACCWGFCFAYLSFCQIWICTPCMKCYMLQLGSVKMCLNSVLDTFCAPCCEACGRCCSQCRITTIQA